VTATVNHTLYAKWTAEAASTYTVTFDAQGGIAPSPATITVTAGATYGTLATTSKAGYIFGGWWTGANGTGSQVLSTTSVTATANHTLYAKWTAEAASTYTVTFDAQGGIVPNPATITVTAGATYGTLATTSKAGYIFGGWWTGANGTGSQVLSTTSVTATVNHTLYAKWIPDEEESTLIDIQFGDGSNVDIIFGGN
jgi:uncharacterized repeat protein (TIGR02543 family)